MPQDPLLLSNETLRFNLDPTTLVKNEILVAALTRTRLLSHFLQGAAGVDERLGEKSGLPNNVLSSDQHRMLDETLSVFPELSMGQAQLFALCRALVKAQTIECVGRKPIVLLDEVTSSLDPTTEEIMHGIIDDEFSRKGHTVICVAHRLEMIAKHMVPGRDVVIVLRDGQLQDVIKGFDPTTLKKLEKLTLG